MKEESVLLMVPGLTLDGDTRAVGDLVFTTRQVFLARRVGDAGPSVPHPRTPAAPRSRSATKHPRTRPLETILATADRRTRFEYRELESIVVNVGGLFSSPGVRLTPHHGRRIKLSGKRSALVLLASAIDPLAGAGAPISLS